ncbi:hypothetical protein MGYG_02260 [Nannizzia gypsea CBS 118893]|uniref:Calcineurin binding protein n=1 Tax=Arthroderma gypseum (strain ATCC MYA-4604 / CBS 118893) TaxID=535722 RepID=E4UQL8_ARTGP|nr:hypothetical protein MGYG_02260 [Nannizzia gypsea CBS 118893]EFQ99247.1 hypothetical protein MGYG_02260 [Nannizzia gypsea CBS 118893]
MSGSSSPRSLGGRRGLPLSIEVPPLQQPSPPSNTLLITDLNDLSLFQPGSLDSIKAHITATAPLNSFSPLPSFRRIVCSFLNTDDAIKVRQLLDRAPLQGKGRARVYFGEKTPIQTDTEEIRRSKLLEAPQSQKMFFISPPPSPPHGWMMRNEEPPNKEVHASDLADALGRLGRFYGSDSHINESGRRPETPVSPTEVATAMGMDVKESTRTGSGQRSRSSTLIYHPEHHGSSPNLPAVMVEDTSVGSDMDSDMDLSPLDTHPKRILAHTSRPPTELMEL